MAEFINPFPGMSKARPISLSELIRALRIDLAAELEATHLYTAHAEATGNDLAKKVLLSIADEERVHAGEFQQLIEFLDSREKELMNKGREEVRQAAQFLSRMGS